MRRGSAGSAMALPLLSYAYVVIHRSLRNHSFVDGLPPRARIPCMGLAR